MTELEGVLAVNKPAGWTSHDVVAKVRRLVKMKRIGHAGTLDPEVTGVLPLCLGRATRVVEYMQDLPKEYQAVLRLGVSTDTEDLTGTVIESVEEVNITPEAAQETLLSFLGEISQVPPMYSAVKVDGKRLYELAREGKTIERKSRIVTVHEIEMTGFEAHGSYTDVSFRVLCSKGTYIRTLCVDIGKKLGLPSTMAKLERTLSAGISASKCLTLEQIEQFMADGTLQSWLVPADEAIVHLHAYTVTDEKRSAALQGQRLSSQVVSPPVNHFGCIRLYDTENQFLGIFQKQEESGAIAPVKVFSV
ncbi:tRNA pseudouridine(55) synthase TruB [Paenibacillus sp. EC2-1]|uniref:tRNA pseudouridine(55) synthase TruB n=1 Tax=Paenibacillus sp. EC2-1 TaxID=3388665 RepID=UPI003BEED08B